LNKILYKELKEENNNMPTFSELIQTDTPVLVDFSADGLVHAK